MPTPPPARDDRLELTDAPLAVGAVHDWAVRADCGAVVVFSGTVRDHSVDEAGERRGGVDHLDYEAYGEQVVPRFAEVAAEVRRRWPHTARVAIVHRTGRIELGEPSVVVAVSAPHRAEAFEAARYAIDAVKASAPIWKHEEWNDGAGWGTAARSIVSAVAVGAEKPDQ